MPHAETSAPSRSLMTQEQAPLHDSAGRRVFFATMCRPEELSRPKTMQDGGGSRRLRRHRQQAGQGALSSSFDPWQQPGRARPVTSCMKVSKPSMRHATAVSTAVMRCLPHLPSIIGPSPTLLLLLLMRLPTPRRSQLPQRNPTVTGSVTPARQHSPTPIYGAAGPMAT